MRPGQQPRRRKPKGPRRRFPYSGLVPVGFAVFGSLAAAGVASLYNLAGRSDLLRETYGESRLPPAPSISNILFGAGLPESMIACALGGWLLWYILWLPVHVRWGADQAKGAALGAVIALLGIPIGIVGIFIRTGTEGIPVLLWPLYALLAVVFGVAHVVFTPWVWLTLGALGVVGGAIAAVVMGLLKPHMLIVER